MATASKTVSRSQLALSLADGAAEPLGSAQPPVLELDWPARADGAGWQVRHGPLSASGPLPRGTALARWLSQACAGQPRQPQGELLIADQNHKLRRRLGFDAALLTRLELGPLDASEGRTPLRMALQWQAASWRDEAGDGQPIKLQAAPRAGLTAANYRLSGLPAANELVQRVELPLLQCEPAPPPTGRRRPGPDLLRLGPLGLVLAGRAREPLQAWRQAHLAQPGKAPPPLDLAIDLLDSTLKKRLAGITLAGCRLLQWQEAPMASSAEALSTLSLKLSVQGMALDLPAP